MEEQIKAAIRIEKLLKLKENSIYSDGYKAKKY